MGYDNPTPIQAKAIPIALQGEDVLGLAQTGTGKTASFMLPILEKLSKGPLKKIRALVIAPTRELAEQIHQSSISLSKYMPIQSVSIYGGVSKYGQIKTLKKGIEIIIACPGRLLDLIGDGVINLSSLEVLVLDEADTMCDMGFLPDVRRIMKYLPKDIQILFFAATMPDEIKELTEDILHNPHTVQIGKIEPAKTVAHYLYPIKSVSLKTKLLFEFFKITATGKVIVFTRTKHKAARLAEQLTKSGIKSESLHGDKSQSARQRALELFKSGDVAILVATDIASRGIDVDDVTHVINYELPMVPEDYVHRIGRTARAGASGFALSLCDQSEIPHFTKIENLIKTKIEILEGERPQAITTKRQEKSIKKKRKKKKRSSKKTVNF